MVMSCFSWPGEWVASPLLRSALHSLWLNFPDNVTCWLVFLREPPRVEANWSRTVSEFHRLTGFFSTIESLFLPPGGGGRKQSTAPTCRGESSSLSLLMLLTNLWYSVRSRQIQMLISWVCELLKSLWWNIDCLLGGEIVVVRKHTVTSPHCSLESENSDQAYPSLVRCFWVKESKSDDVIDDKEFLDWQAPRLPAVLFALVLLCLGVFVQHLCASVTDSADDVEWTLQSVMTHDMVEGERCDGM